MGTLLSGLSRKDRIEDARQFVASMKKNIEKIKRRMKRDGWYLYDPKTGKEKRTHATPTTWDINNGWCEEFMYEVLESNIGIGVHDMEGSAASVLGLGGDETLHVWVEWRGKHYDAECIEGVSDPRDLPIFKNQGKPRELVLKERGER